MLTKPLRCLRARARAQKSIKDVLRRVVGADVVDDKKDFISKEVDRIISSGVFLAFLFQRCACLFFLFFCPTTKTSSQKKVDRINCSGTHFTCLSSRKLQILTQLRQTLRAWSPSMWCKTSSRSPRCAVTLAKATSKTATVVATISPR